MQPLGDAGCDDAATACTVVSGSRYNARIASRFNYTVGLIWPSPSGEPKGRDDRIANQLLEMEKYAKRKSKRNLKIILRVGNFNFDGWLDGQEQFVRDRCPIVDCSLTKDVKKAPTADALLISEFSHRSRSTYLPKPRHQIWIAQHWESPMHDRIDTAAVSGLINWTASYRRESTIAFSYGRYYQTVVNGTRPPSNETINYATGKTKKVAWFVSNCHAANSRQRYAVELSKFIQVDIFGKCTRRHLSCPRTKEKFCFEKLEREYKFYLAFENSNCNDYITEKLSYNGLSHKIIPIVMGARSEDYAAFAPTHSYIHVDDFASPRHLAAYLNKLDHNDALYNEYFSWKGAWTSTDGRYWCRLCMLLHWRDEVNYISWYDNYRNWWNGACYRDASLPWFQRNGGDSKSKKRRSPKGRQQSRSRKT
jgi:glycoprotein 3-alpha-L-fucosyltransferase